MRGHSFEALSKNHAMPILRKSTDCIFCHCPCTHETIDLHDHGGGVTTERTNRTELVSVTGAQICLTERSL